MTAKQALTIVSAKIHKRVAVKCLEYNSCFVFRMVPPMYEMLPDLVYDCLFSVNKKTGKVGTFQPVHIPIEEYRNGKEIKNFR